MEQGLSIGGYELYLLVDLVASYLFEKYKNNFHQKVYRRIYCNDGLEILKEIRRFKRLYID